MKSVLILLAAMVLTSCVNTSKFVASQDYSELNGEYYAYSVEEKGKTETNIASFFSTEKEQPTTFTLEAKNGSLYISYLHHDELGASTKRTFSIQGKRKKRFIKDVRSREIIPFYPIIASIDIQTIRFGKDKDNNLLIHQYIDNSGAILFMGAGGSGEKYYIFKKLDKIDTKRFYSEQGMFGIINEKGEKITPPMFSEMAPFSDGIAEVKVGGKKGIIDEDGNFIIPAEYEVLEKHWRETPVTYWASKEGKFGILDKEGKELVPFIYDKVETHYSEFYKLYKGNKIGIYVPFEVHIPPMYSDLAGYNMSAKRLLMLRENQPYIVDFNGNEYKTFSEKYKMFQLFPEPQRQDIEGVYYEKQVYYPKLDTRKKIEFAE